MLSVIMINVVAPVKCKKLNRSYLIRTIRIIWIGTCQRSYSKNCVRNYVDNYVGNYVGDFIGNNEVVYIMNYEWDYVDNHVGNFVGNYIGIFV
jgi:hypothetical protein